MLLACIVKRILGQSALSPLKGFLARHSSQSHWASAYRIVQDLEIRRRLRDFSALLNVVPKHVIVHLGGIFLR